jgi:hypothetical protein
VCYWMKHKDSFTKGPSRQCTLHDSNLLSNATPVPKELCFLEGLQLLYCSPSDEINM